MYEKPTVELKDWSIRGQVAYGKAYGHPRFTDGTRVITSTIQNVTELDDVVRIETRNTIYMCKIGDEQANE